MLQWSYCLLHFLWKSSRQMTRLCVYFEVCKFLEKQRNAENASLVIVLKSTLTTLPTSTWKARVACRAQTQPSGMPPRVQILSGTILADISHAMQHGHLRGVIWPLYENSTTANSGGCRQLCAHPDASVKLRQRTYTSDRVPGACSRSCPCCPR